MVLAQVLGIDERFLAFIGTVHMDPLTEFFIAITALGSVTVIGIIILGLWLYNERETAVLSAVSVTLAGGTTKLLKILVARARPGEVENLLLYGADSYAFPSGHATLAFATAVVLARSTERTAARVYLYGIATLVAVSRVYLGVHYLTDVIAGAAIGMAGGSLVWMKKDVILRRLDAVL